MAALVLGPLAVLGMFTAVDPVVVDSVYVPVARLDVLPLVVRARLSAAGIESPQQLLRATARAADRADWAARTALPLEDLEEARARVELVVHRGLGLGRAHDLDALGIRTLDDLARWSAEDLAAAIAQRRPHDPRNRFLARRARVWTSGLAEPRAGGAR
jgi:predicted flap endonuclease-1-like 5' DNA nuclease